LGAFEPFPKATTRQINKKFDTTANTNLEWNRGFLVAYDPAVTTKNEYIIAKATAEKPFYVSIGYALKQITGQSYIVSDQQFTLLGALQSDPLANALFEGVVNMPIDGIVQPGQQVMPADGTTSHSAVTSVLGHVQAWDGSNRKTIVGVYLGKIGQSGGRWTRTATTDVTGSLGKVQVLPGG
jgi:hypothetical protein